MDWLGLAFFIVIAVLAAPILAMVAMVRAAQADENVEALRREIAALRREMSPRLSQARPSVQPEAARPVQPEPVKAPSPLPAHDTPRPVAPPPAPPPVAVAPLPAFASPASPQGEGRQTTWAQTSASLERMIAANWLVWLGAAALALGGIFLVRYAWEQGYFGPLARTIAATVAGFAMIAGSEWLRRKIPADAVGQIGRAPLAVAAAGAVTLYGAAYAAGPLYHLVSPELTLAGFVAASAVAVGLAMRHGMFLAALGLTGGFAAPLLVGGGTPDPAMLLAYAFAVTLAGLVLVRAFDWKPIVWVALIGAGIWMVLGAMMAGLNNGAIALLAYALALLAAATALAWSDANAFVIRKLLPDTPAGAYPTQTVAAAYGFWILSGIGLLAVFVQANAASRDLAMIALGLYGVAAIGVGWRRVAFMLIPLFGAAAFLAGLYLAPVDRAFVMSPGIGFQPFADPGALTYRFLSFGIVGTLATGLGGWLAMRSMDAGKTHMAVTSAFTPLLLLVIAFDKLGGLQQHFSWGLAGGVIALLNLAALEGLKRAPGGLDAAKGAGAAYALGTFAASMFGVGASLGDMWMTMLFAMHLPAIAIIDRRFNLPALKLCASIAGIVVMARALAPPEVTSYVVSSTPILNELTVLYGVTLLCFWGAARLFAVNLKSSEPPLVQALDVGAITLLVVLVTVQIRHVATGGYLPASDFVLVEVSANTVAFIGLAMGLAARLGAKPRPWPGVAVNAVYWLAVASAVLGLGLRYNPLLLSSAQVLDGPPLINLIAASYLPPAVLFGVHAVLARRNGQSRAAFVSGFVALALAFLYVTLEVRNAFHVDLVLGAMSVSEAESYGYSIAWLLFAIALLAVGLIRKQMAIRHAAMAVLALSVAKVFLLDMSSLTGVLRAASFMGLGLALIAIAYLYQRLVFRRGAA